MSSLFLVCAVVGGAVLALQIVLGLVGLAHDWELPGFGYDVDVHDADDALNVLSVRALAAGLLFFGLAGLTVGGPLAILAALGAGLAALLGVAAVMRALRRLEGDAAVRLHRAVGETGSVYLGIPAGRAGTGKVHLTLQGRTVECRALSEHALPTGASVLVIDVVGPDLVEVVPSPLIGVFDDAR
ncbi:MAG TPA: hypothetical protein VFX98_15415 [Longimicrobiaceae bacterium]|nr:hypothetical protein [Longimicrobiaceae bacterium]